MPKFKYNARQKMDGRELLKQLPDRSVNLVFCDPQYRGVLDKLNYGNEGEGRQAERAELPQMPDDMIAEFVAEVDRVLVSSGHLCLWVDKFSIGTRRWAQWLPDVTPMSLVDILVWDKINFGNGRRFRGRSEFLLLIQKGPLRAADKFNDHGIGDVFPMKAVKGGHPHAKPIQLIQRLIESMTEPGDLVCDPCAGGYGVFDACRASARMFVGCDLL